MNLPRLALAGILISVISTGSCIFQAWRRADLAAEFSVVKAELAGFTREAKGKPKIPDLPRGVKPVATVEGGVKYLPRRPAPGLPALPPPPAAGGGCDLDALTVDVDCRAEVANAGGIGVARLWVHGLLTDGTRKRELPWARVGDPITIRPPGEPEQPVETREPEVHVNAPDPRRGWSLDLRAGLTTDAGVRLGATFYPRGSRWGIAADWERDGAEQRAAVLASVRVGPR